MDFRKLRYFLAVADAGSFSKASTSISIAQPALSRQVRQLEEELHAPLFYRNGRGVILTQAGELLLSYARTFFDHTAQIEREIAALGKSPHGTLTLGFLPSLSGVLLKPLMRRIAERHPTIKLQIREGMSGTMLDWLQDGKVDLAVVYESRCPRSIATERLLADTLFVVSAPNAGGLPGSVTGEQLSTRPLVLPGRSHGMRQLIESAMTARGYGLNVQFEIDSLQMMKELVAEGRVSTILPYSAVADDVGHGRLQVAELIEPSLQRRLVLATSTAYTLDAVKRLVVSTIQSVAKELGPENRWKTARQTATEVAA